MVVPTQWRTGLEHGRPERPQVRCRRTESGVELGLGGGADSWRGGGKRKQLGAVLSRGVGRGEITGLGSG